MKKLNSENPKCYLQNNTLTEQFLPYNAVADYVNINIKNKHLRSTKNSIAKRIKSILFTLKSNNNKIFHNMVSHKDIFDENANFNKTKEIITSLMGKINKEIHLNKTDEENLMFNRTAKKIWDSKEGYGSTDYALVFATFARQLGIPTTILETLSEQSYNEVLSAQDPKDVNKIKGHFFCECYIGGKWILVNPTKMEIQEEYSPNKIELPDSTPGGLKTYIPINRCLDCGFIESYTKRAFQLLKQRKPDEQNSNTERN